MSGHSKWSTIKRKKGAADAKRGKMFSRLAREIMVAARSGGDPNGNPRLRRAMDLAKAANMPGDNINRAIKKGTGELGGEQIEEFSLEGYGPGGAALLIEVMTDNRNRSLAEIRHLMSKNGGSLGEPGCVAWLFEKKGILRYEKSKTAEDTLMEKSLDAGAEDMKDEGDCWEVLTDLSDVDVILNKLVESKLAPTETEITAVPKNTVALSGKEAESMLKLIDALEEHDDVQNVYANMDISDQEMERISEDNPMFPRRTERSPRDACWIAARSRSMG